MVYQKNTLLERQLLICLRLDTELYSTANWKTFNLSSSSIKYIKVTHTTEEGKKAENTAYEINKETIEEQSKYDGFYAVSTSLSHQEMPVKEIIKINKGRWQIEESLRILKSDFKSRPVFVRVKDRIQAHFIICFISLLVFRLMHRRINEIQAQKEEEVLKNNKDQEVADSQEIPNKMHTNSQIIRTLKNMRVTKVLSGYAGSFTSTGLTDILQSFLGETRFDCEYLEPSMLRRGIKNSKKRDIKKSKKFRVKNPKGGHYYIFEMSRTSGTLEFSLI